MSDSPLTLFNRLRQAPDNQAWTQFVRLYTPLLFGWARNCGESDHDAADLVQEVFVAFLKTLPTLRIDEPGQLRAWLRTVMLNKLRDRKRREVRAEKGLQELRPEAELPQGAESFWDTEYYQKLARRALRVMQAEFNPSTWKACWETVVEGRPVANVAQELGITENAVYVAKCRVLRRLRQELSDLGENGTVF
jgi:RNA polymerase sigma-70 factor (ECF subfamily)